MKKVRENVLAAVIQNCMAFGGADVAVKRDEENILAAVRYFGWAITYV